VPVQSGTVYTGIMDISGFITKAVEISNLDDYESSYTELGGGELNETFLLQCRARKVILHISRYNDHNNLRDEASALKILANVPGVPNLIFFDEDRRINNRLWIIEEYVAGTHSNRLSVQQFHALGALLANVHTAGVSNKLTTPWEMLIKNCRGFGNEEYLLNHPDPQLARSFNKVKLLCDAYSEPNITVLAHCDITPSNTLVFGDDVRLIDWEFASYRHPMAEFASGYYRDIDLNNGKWRQSISDEELSSLLDGYKGAGGEVDESLLGLYEIIDKVGVTAYLYWRLNISDWQPLEGMKEQYMLDYAKILTSINGDPKEKYA